MSEWKAKRFWKEAQVVETDHGYQVELDGRPIKTPAKSLLLLPTKEMAQRIAAEWDAQEDAIDPLSMPATRTANAALDKVAQRHADVANMLAAYGDSDLLCYRADGPQELVQLQADAWDPILEWAEHALGARLEPRTGVMHAPQDAIALSKLSGLVHDMSPFQLAAFHDLVSLTGSLVLGFAAIEDSHDPHSIWQLSRLDEDWQAEQWGADDEAEAAASVKRAAFLHAKEMFDICLP